MVLPPLIPNQEAEIVSLRAQNAEAAARPEAVRKQSELEALEALYDSQLGAMRRSRPWS